MKEDQILRSVEDHMPQFIKRCLLDGSYAVPEKDWFPGYAETFYNTYDEVTDNLRIGAVPLDVDAGTKTFFMNKTFLQQADPQQLQEYRVLLRERFNIYYRNDLAPDDEDSFRFPSSFDEDGEEKDMEDLYGDEGTKEDYPDRPSPVLPYRAATEAYVTTDLEELLAVPEAYREAYDEGVEKTDSYGLIENRQKRFFVALAALCNHYSLPKLPVKFAEDGKPFFRARPHEIQAVQALYIRRLRMDSYLTQDITDEYPDVITDIDDLDPGDDVEKGMSHLLEVSERLSDLRASNKEQWQKENDTYQWPSAIASYTGETLDALDLNSDMDFHGSNTRFQDIKEELADLVEPAEGKIIVPISYRLTWN